MLLSVVLSGNQCVCVGSLADLAVRSRLCLGGCIVQPFVLCRPTMVEQAPRNTAAKKTLRLHPFAMKVPAAKRTGNAATDEDNDSKIQLLSSCLSVSQI